MWLVLDIGNSAAKGGLYDGAALQRVFHVDLQRVDTAVAWKRTLDDALAGQAIARAGISSVVPAATPHACAALAQLTGTAAEQVHVGMRLPFTLNYATPETLGVDRLAAAAAAWQRYGPHDDAQPTHPVVAVDAGTAVTIEVVTRTGVYEGGLIGPGPALLARALRDGTAQLPAVPLELPARTVGRSTQEALQSGVMGGFVESVRGLLRRVQATLDAPPVVVATGGWSALLAQEIDAIDAVAPHLVLDGIRVLMTLNPPGQEADSPGG